MYKGSIYYCTYNQDRFLQAPSTSAADHQTDSHKVAKASSPGPKLFVACSTEDWGRGDKYAGADPPLNL